MTEEKNYKSAYEILKHPLADLRVEVADKFSSSKLVKQDFMNICTQLIKKAEKIDGVSQTEVAKEVQNAFEFIRTGKSLSRPNVKDSVTQFVWGVALACSVSDPNIKASWTTPEKNLPVHKFEVWEQIKESATARAELRRHAFMVTKLPFMKEDVRMKWGSCNYPNVGFYYNDNRNMINLDMLWALIGGFEHSRAAQLHEIGHSQGTLVYTPQMQKIQKEHKELNQKVRDGKASTDDYRKLKILEKEYKFRFSIYDEAENSFANRFAANAADFGKVRQDIGYDLNSLETELFNVGKSIRKFEKRPQNLEDTVFNRSYNLKQAIRYSFFVNNGIVEDDVEGWKKLGVNIDWIEYKSPDGEHLQGEAAFKKLREMTKTLEKLQLKERDYNKSEEEIYNISLEYSKRRSEIIDEIYEGFAKDYFDEYVRQTGANDNQQQSEGNNGDNQEYNIFDTPPEEVIDDEGHKPDHSDDSDLGNAVGHDSSGDETGEQGGEQADKNDEQQAQNNDNEQQNDNTNEEKRNYDDLSEEEKANLIRDEKGNIEREEFKSIFENLDLDIDENDLKPLEDLFENPEEKLKALIGMLQEGVEEDDEDAEDIIDIIRAPIDQENSEDDKQEKTEVDDMGPYSVGNVGVREFPKTLMPENEFSKIVEKNFDLIEKLKVKFTDLQNKYYDENPQAESLAAIPDAGDLRIDIPSYIERLKKQITGEELKEKDFENFVVQSGAQEDVKAPIDIAILIDTSGSMHWARTDKFAIELGCVLYQATRDNPAFNVYVALMTYPTTWVAKPGENSIEISRRLATVSSMGIGDDKIGDNIVSVLNEVKERNPQSKAEGLTNLFMITDGDHTDHGYSFPLIEKAIETGVPATFNWVLTEKKEDSYSCNVIDRHQSGVGAQKIEYADEVDNSNMLEKIVSLIEKRVDGIKEIEALKTKEKTDNIATFLSTYNSGGRKW